MEHGNLSLLVRFTRLVIQRPGKIAALHFVALARTNNFNGAKLNHAQPVFPERAAGGSQRGVGRRGLQLGLAGQGFGVDIAGAAQLKKALRGGFGIGQGIVLL